MAFGLLAGTIFLFAMVVSGRHPHGGAAGTRGGGVGAGRGKLAVLWVFTGEPAFYWKWTLATLLNGGADHVDVHLLMGVDTDKLQSYREQLRDFAQSDKVFFHSVSPAEWRARISRQMGLNITYPLETLGRKVSDFKPCLGDLFQDFIPPKEYAFWVYGDSDGFFGSYDRLLDRSVLPSYDVVSGLPPPPQGSEAWSSIPGQWVPAYCTGGWTLMRNTPRINQLYRRSAQWRDVLSSPKYRSFDEGQQDETVQSVLKTSADDVRRCCINDRVPQVLAKPPAGIDAPPFHMYIAGVDATYVEKNNSLTVLWKAGEGLTVTLEGEVGRGGAYRREVSRVLFLHFLQLKYCCSRELFGAMQAFLADIDAKKGSVLDLRCFTLHATAHKMFVFAVC